MNISKMTTLLCSLVFGSYLGGCATILNDDHQAVAFNSDPNGATVMIDGIAMGTTPCVIPVARKGGDKMVQFDLAGYKTLIVELDNDVGAAAFGNIIFGGVIGAGIDAASGRGGTYQDSLIVTLERGSGIIMIESQELEAARKAAQVQYKNALNQVESDSSETAPIAKPAPGVESRKKLKKSNDWIYNKAD